MKSNDIQSSTSRRVILKTRAIRLFWLAAAAIAIWSVFIEPRLVTARHQLVVMPHAGKLAGLRIAVASDWHFTKRALWRVMTVERAQNIVADINASHPDIILLPGDFIADTPYRPTIAATQEEEIASVLGQLKAPLGVYAVLGNHDWWQDAPKFKAALVRHGIRVLENEAVPIADTGAWLVGIGDDYSGHSKPRIALRDLPQQAPALIFMHDPISFAEFPPGLNAISFAGHTHGGQVSIPWVGALTTSGRTPLAWAYGWVRHHQNSMYVTSGLGVSMLPLRFNMRPEWVTFTIQ